MMMHMAFAGPGWRSLKIERQLDLVTAPTIAGAVLAAVAGTKSNLLIDLDAVDAADDLGIAALIAAMAKVRADHPSMRLAVLACRALLADSIVRDLPAGTAEVYRDRRAAHAAIAPRAAA
ncbi:MAG TPA: STAS domain-containing protein [Candidatus Eremiobacteraceae bacterium]